MGTCAIFSTVLILHTHEREYCRKSFRDESMRIHMCMRSVYRVVLLRAIFAMASTVKPSGVILMEGSEAAKREEQAKNVAHCPPPIVDTRLYLGHYFRAPTKQCRGCEGRHRASKMV